MSAKFAEVSEGDWDPWKEVEKAFQPVKKAIVDPIVKETVKHGKQFTDTVSRIAEEGAVWAAGGAAKVGQWTAGAAEDVSAWTQQASKDAVKWTSDTGKNIAQWSEDAVQDVEEWSSGAARDVEKWCGDAVEDVQEFAEGVGTFISKLGKDAKTWVLELLNKFAGTIDNAVKDTLGQVAVCGVDKIFPNGDLNSVIQSPCFLAVENIGKLIVKAISGISSGVNRLASVIANVMSDGDMYNAIFGMIGENMVNQVEVLFDGNFDEFIANSNVISTARKVIAIMTTYFRKHASRLSYEILPLIDEVVRYVDTIADQMKKAIDSFVGSLSLAQLDGGSGSNVTDTAAHEAKREQITALQASVRNFEGLTYYVALCGGGAAVFANTGICIYYPFTLGKFPQPNKIVFEFGFGLQAEGGAEISGGIKVGPILTNNMDSLTGEAQSLGVDIDAGISGTMQKAIDIGLTWPYPDQSPGPISLDIEGGVGTGLNKADGVSGGAPTSAGDFSPFYSMAVGMHPLEKVPNFETIPSEVADAFTDGHRSLIATNVSATGKRLKINPNAREKWRPRANGRVYAWKVSSDSGLAESAIDHKYSVLNGPCLPGTAILTASECLYAYKKLYRRKLFTHPSKRGLVKGSWNGVPWACSIHLQDPWIEKNRDSSPHFNDFATTDNSRAVSGEFRPICRRAYRLGTKGQKACPAGSAITSPRDCWNAYVELQGNFTFPPKRGLVKGSWVALPLSCSIHIGNSGDQSPHWNTAASSDGSRATTGEFLPLCKPQRFWMEDRGSAERCPFGSTIDFPDECQNAYDALQHMFAFPSPNGLQKRHHDHVNAGCSQRFIKDHWDPYFNTHTDVVSYEQYVPMCKEPSYWMATTQYCPQGLGITDEFVCRAAYEQLRNTFAYPSKRGLVKSPWEGIPPGCSVQTAGTHHDNPLLFNDMLDKDRSHLLLDGQFRPLCLPGKYFLTPKGQKCPDGHDVKTQEECQHAFDAFGPSWKYPAQRAIQVRNWGARVPRCFALSEDDSSARSAKDQTPHFSTHPTTSPHSAYVAICKAR